MKLSLVPASAIAVILAASAACSSSGTGGCDPLYFSHAIPTGLASDTAGRYAFVAASWYRRDGSCGPGHFGGALHLLDLMTLAPTTLDGLPSLTGKGAYVANEFIALPGIYGPANEYYRVTATPPFTLTTVPLATGPTDLVSDGRQAFIALPGQSEVLVHTTGATDASIATIGPGPGGAHSLALAWGKLYVSNGGTIAEIDPATRSQIRTFSTCAGPGGIAPVGSHTLLTLCTAGLGLVDVSAGTTMVLATSETFSFVTGSPVSEHGLAQVPGPSPGTGGNVRVLTLGSGETGLYSGTLDGSAAFLSSTSAFAVLQGIPYQLDLGRNTAATLLGGIGLNPDVGRIAGLGSGLFAAFGGNTWYQLSVVRYDPKALQEMGSPISMTPPTQLPFQ